ncbi:MAG TPA: hypothetical protein VNM14_11925 [Planctomycetota bacterium]|jgi:hypothetical protein|nr:hypothetical protein [Planctomycetota bacterium]
MTCDDARTQTLREIGGDGDPDRDARAHLSGCALCADYRRDAERVWTLSGRATETCPRRRSIFEARASRRAPSSIAAAAAALIAAASLTTWALWPARTPTIARQDPDANAEDLLRKDPELRKQVLRTAVQEKERLAEFEKKLAGTENGFTEAKALLDAGKTADATARGEALLASYPKLKVVVLDPSELKHRSSMLWFRIRELVLTGQLTLLREQPEPEEDGRKAERTGIEIRLMNDLRESKRQQEILKNDGPQPRKDAVIELGADDPTLRKQTLDKIRSIRMTVSIADGSAKDLVSYFREISKLNIVLEGSNEQREAKVSIELQDVTMEALLDHFSKLAGYAWEVDRFGILFFKSPKK